MSTATSSPLLRFMLLCACFVVIVAGMRTAAPILVPCLLALFMAVLVTPWFIGLQRRGLPDWAALLLLILILVVLGGVGVVVVGSALSAFAEDIPSYQANLQERLEGLGTWLQQRGVETPRDLVGTLKPETAMRLLGDTARSLSGLLSNTFLILLVVIFILLEARALPGKIRGIPELGQRSVDRLAVMAEDIRRYVSIKTVLSLLTGVLVTVLLWLLGVDNALVMGLLAFLLNYIPNIGSIIAAIPGVLLALLQSGSGVALWACVGYVAINLVVGNVLEPRLLGRGLGLSPLIIVVTMLFWGWVLGPVGMLLAVPLTMVLKIALEGLEETRWIATLMGDAVPEPAVAQTAPG